MERWFDTGLLMEDGRTTISVRAENDLQAAEYAKKGWELLSTEQDRKKKSKGKRDGWRE